jgi:hypothetical protein
VPKASRQAAMRWGGCAAALELEEVMAVDHALSIGIGDVRDAAAGEVKHGFGERHFSGALG